MLIVLLSVIFVGIVAAGFVPQYQKHLALEKRLGEVQAEKARQESRLQSLRVSQERFQNDRDYVRKIAHEIGMVEPHEMIFRFHEDNPRARVSTP